MRILQALSALASVGLTASLSHDWIESPSENTKATQALQNMLEKCSVSDALTEELSALSDKYDLCNENCALLEIKLKKLYKNLEPALSECSEAQQTYEWLVFKK